MSNIYDQHRASFSSVSAYVIVKDGERVASVAFKFPRDGAGRLYCYFHIFGVPMVRGFANGYGYDKRSAAAESAVERIKATDAYEAEATHIQAIQSALAGNSGYEWSRRIEDVGYKVFQAV